MVARTRFEIVFCRASHREDLPELGQASLACREALEGAMGRIRARQDQADPKSGRLLGTFSESFSAGPQDRGQSGRVVYVIEGPTITILAVHADHDEAYRRARIRFRG